jgi:small multidrug resistance family-3 protein
MASVNATSPPSLSPQEGNSGSAHWTVAQIIFSIFLFILAGILEIGGGWLVWKGIRENKSPALFITTGSIVLVCYGFVPTLQPSDSFGRIFAVYGGFFIVLSYAWVALIDGFVPDTGDYIGAAIALVGVSISWFWPRP